VGGGGEGVGRSVLGEAQDQSKIEYGQLDRARLFWWDGGLAIVASSSFSPIPGISVWPIVLS